MTHFIVPGDVFMEVRILGAHNIEGQGTKHTCFLIDGELAVDAGSLSSALTPEEQAKVSAVLITHSHFDHVRDIPTLGLCTLWEPGCTSIYSQPATLQAVHDNLLNWDIYPDFTTGIDGGPPKFQFRPVKPNATIPVLDYEIKPIPVPHAVPCVGYIVKSASGACIGYTGDMEGGLQAFLQDPLKPSVIFVDLTFPDRLGDLAKTTGHLTPAVLGEQLRSAVAADIEPPKIVAVHLSPYHQDELAAELSALSQEMGLQLDLGYEGMRIAA